MPSSCHTLLHSTLIGALCGLLSGCFGSVADVRHRHYVLDGAAPPVGHPSQNLANKTGEPLALKSLWVRDFNIGAVYDRAQLVRRLGAHEVEFVRSEVWAARLGRMLADAVARSWVEGGLLGAINRSSQEASQDYTLTGEVTVLEVDCTQEVRRAHLAWMLQLCETHTGRVIGQHVFDDMRPVKGDEQAADAFNALLLEAATQGMRALAAPFAADVKASAPAH